MHTTDALHAGSIRSDADAMKEWLVSVRRAIHEYPELGNEEFVTADRIGQELSSLGISYERTDTAIVGIVRGVTGGKTVGLRADIDALPIQEATGLPFASKNAGHMHACGHDAHTTILLGCARWFSEHREHFSGAVKLFFQPAEESSGGAEIMVSRGCLANPTVDHVFGLHVMPYLPVGEVEVKYGTLNGCSTGVTITVHGKSGHGAYPETGVDAILVASELVIALNTLVSRRVSPLDSAVFSIGKIQGGVRTNIVADEVTLSATLRAGTDELRDRMIGYIRNMVDGVCAAHGAQGTVDIRYGYAALVNHHAEVDMVCRTAERILGPGSVQWKEKPSMGVEDFSFFIRDTPGAFYHLGCAPKGFSPGDPFYPLHSDCFILNEDCLPVGVAMQTALTLEALGGHVS